MRGIVKRFGAVTPAPASTSRLHAGDVLGLLGENGAGKTSLMNVLFGTYAPDAGTIPIEGRPVQIRNSADALELGIGMVHQHFQLVPRHTVLENLLVGRAGRGWRLDRAGALARLREIGDAFRLDLDPDALVGDSRSASSSGWRSSSRCSAARASSSSTSRRRRSPRRRRRGCSSRSRHGRARHGRHLHQP